VGGLDDVGLVGEGAQDYVLGQDVVLLRRYGFGRLHRFVVDDVEVGDVGEPLLVLLVLLGLLRGADDVVDGFGDLFALFLCGEVVVVVEGEGDVGDGFVVDFELLESLLVLFFYLLVANFVEHELDDTGGGFLLVVDEPVDAGDVLGLGFLDIGDFDEHVELEDFFD
jgi:hypothetical protein